MDQNPYQAPQFMNGPPPAPPSDDWPWWVRIVLGKRKSRKRAQRRVGLWCLAWAGAWIGLAGRRLAGDFDLAIMLSLTMVVLGGLIAVWWVNRHERWPEKPADRAQRA